MEPRIDLQARGVRLIAGDLAADRRRLINLFADTALAAGYEEIVIPCVEPAQIYADKAGPEILGQMYTFADRGDRELCLRPEGTATLQLLASGPWRRSGEKRVFYETRCWRYEKPQAGRYREFTQLGVEVLNPRKATTMDEAVDLAAAMAEAFLPGIEWNLDEGAKRGLAYYEGGQGFEITVPSLGAQKQILGGGAYKEGFGFAFGLDRLMLARSEAAKS